MLISDQVELRPTETTRPNRLTYRDKAP